MTNRIAGVLVVALIGLVIMTSAGMPSARAAPAPTLSILTPADNAIIGNGSPVAVTFWVTNFNLTDPGTGGPAASVGHADVFVDGTLATVASTNTLVLFLPSGPHVILLRLVTDNGSALNPDVSASVHVMVTRGPASAMPGLAVAYPADGAVVGTDCWVDFRVANFALVPLGSPPGVPGEGRVRVYVDGVYYSEQTTDEAVHFNLPDGRYNVTFELVDSGSRSLTPRVTASVDFTVKALVGRTVPTDLTPYLAGVNIVLGLAILAAIYRKLEV